MIDPQTLARMPRRAMTLLLILVPIAYLSAFLAAYSSPTPWMQQVAARAIPATIKTKHRTWIGITEKMPKFDMLILETKDILLRQYSDGDGRPVSLCVVFSADNRKGTHPPDVCLSGAGSHINFEAYRNVSLGDGKVINVRELVASVGNVNRYFAYFYKYSNHFTSSFYWQQIMLVWDGLIHHNPSGALIRYDVRMRDSQALAGARKRVDALIRATYPAIRYRLHVPTKAAAKPASATTKP